MPPLPTPERNRSLLIVAVITGLIASGVVISIVFFQPKASVVAAVPLTNLDFGTSTPANFPADIPIERSATSMQKYTLDHSGQTQYSASFSSAQTVAENRALYASFFSKEGWTIINEYETDSLSALYGTKDSLGMSVVLTGTASSSTSHVSISVLTK